MFVELIYGFLSNSLGLISDSVHMLIDSSALAIGVYASFVARLAPNATFPFGYERVEILSGFVNGIFLLFVVVEIISESFERLLNPQPVAPEKMILVSTLGLAINILGLFFFHEHSHFHSEAEDDTAVELCEQR
jgi:zinc transporter 5/7